MNRAVNAVSLPVWCVLILGLATSAVAQNRSTSVGVGYQYLKFDDIPVPLGVSADLVVDVTRQLAAVGEIDWSRDKAQEFGLDTTNTVLGVGGGVQWIPFPRGRFRPYAKAVAGVQRNTVDIERFGSDLETNAVFRLGGGITMGMVRRLDGFAQVDWHRIQRDTDRDGVRVVVGGRFNIR